MIYGLILAAVATMAPSPSPAALPPCTKPNHEGGLLKAVVPKVSPVQLNQAEDDGAQMWATVKLLIGPDGSVQEATIYRSSGSTALDNAAVTAAKAATYSPKVVNCQPVAGVYLLRLPLDASP